MGLARHETVKKKAKIRNRYNQVESSTTPDSLVHTCLYIHHYMILHASVGYSYIN